MCVSRHNEIFRIRVDMLTALSYLSAWRRFAFELGWAVSQSATALSWHLEGVQTECKPTMFHIFSSPEAYY